jgi:hypothetical protein
MQRSRLLAAAAVVTLAALGAAAPAEARPLHTGFGEPSMADFRNGLTMLDRGRSAGTTHIRLTIHWESVAPPVPPEGFDAANHRDPAYDWAAVDAKVVAARQRGLQPILNLLGAPRWAEMGRRHASDGPPGTVRPDAVEFGKFARAAATRYSGRVHGLPRVRFWQAWNEPNLSIFLNPQFDGQEPYAPGHYREMVNEFAAGVKTVHRDNLVIAGGTAPFRDLTPHVVAVNPRWGPLTFMRELLCLSSSLTPTCRHRVHFDIWAHHPYTSGSPTRRAVLPDDVSLGDLGDMRRTLMAGVRAGNVVTSQPVGFWVTEYGWDTNPPDPGGVPIPLHTRWVAEGLYRAWTHGVTLVTWHQLRDEPMATSFYQTGLFFGANAIANDRPKPAFRAFRFPVVAIPQKNGVMVWGRTPFGRPGTLVVEQSFRGGWKTLARMPANRFGIFQRTFRTSATGHVRARLLFGGEQSVPFGVRPVPDRFFNPFGLPELVDRQP